MDNASHGTSRYKVEYDAYGQVIVDEGSGKHSLRSRSSAGGYSKSVHEPDKRSAGSADRPEQTNDAGLLQTYPGAGQRDPPETPQSNGSPRYRRRSNTVGDETTETVVSAGGTVSTASSSLLRRIIRRNQRRRDSDSDSDAARHSDYGIDRRKAKRSGGRHKKRRGKKKHKGRSIDKHSDPSASRRYSASDIYDVGGPDNDYWRGMVAEQRRLSSLDKSARRSSRESNSSSQQRRRGSEGNKFSVRPPRINGTSPATSVGTGSTSQYGGSGGASLVRRSGRRQSSSASKVDGDRCGTFPMFMFIVVGCLLVIVGTIRIFVSFWHEFGSSVWSGALLLLFGCMHAVFARKYDQHIKARLYIAVGVATSASVLVATAFSLIVLVPVLSRVTAGIDDSLDDRVLSAVNFSKFATNKTVTGVESVTWPSVVLDSLSLLLLTVALYSQTATVIAIDRYWNDNYKLTGDCRYCGPPRLCNPIDQMSLGQATIFVGLVHITMLEYVPDHDSSSPHAWSTVWSGALVLVAGFSGLCYGKRPDSNVAGMVSVALMSCSLLGCAVTIVLTTLSIVKDADRLRVTVENTQSSQPYSPVNLIALVVIQGVADLISAVGVLFVASNLFRQLKRLCNICAATIIDTQQMSISSSSHRRPHVVAATSL